MDALLHRSHVLAPTCKAIPVARYGLRRQQNRFDILWVLWVLWVFWIGGL